MIDEKRTGPLYRRVLENPATRLILPVSVAGNVGSWVRAAALTVYFAQQDALVALAIFMSIRQGAQLLVLPLLGVWVDSVKKRLPMTMCLVASSVCTALAAWAMTFDTLSAIVAVFSLSVLGALSVLANSAFMMAVVPLLYPSDERPVINSAMGSISTLSLTVGPALTGALLFVVNIPSILLLDSIMLLTAAAFVYRLKLTEVSQDHADHQGRNGFARLGIARGIEYVSKDWRLLGLVFLGAGSFAGVGATWIINPSLTNEVGLGVPYIGYVMSVIGLGSFAGMVLGGVLASRGRHVRICIGGVLLFAASMCLWGQVSTNLGVLIWFLPAFMMGFFACIHESSYWTFIQNHVPQNVMGRVTTAIDSLTLGGMLLGTLAAQFVIVRSGPAAATATSAMLMLGFWGCGTALVLLGILRHRRTR